MMGDERKALEHVSVNCSTCETRVTASVREAAYHVKCPDCFEQVKIPSRETVLKKLEEKERLKAKPDDVGTYGLSAVPEGPKADGLFALEEEKLAEPKYILLNCEMCNARLHPEVKDEAYHLTCPDCHTELRVPAEWEVPSESKINQKPEQADHDPGSYELGETQEPPPASTDYFEKREAIRQEKVDPPPNWAFFSNVFEFPWMKGTLSHWVYMSLLIEALGLLAAFPWSLSQGESGPNYLVIALFALPVICLSIWTATYSAACFLPVVIDTAAGNNSIHGWSEPNWRESIPQLLYVGYLESVAALAGLAGATIVELSGGPFWLTFCIINYLIYPVMLLSSLEAGSVFILLTLPILKCMATHWWCWLLFYIEIGIIWGLWVGLLMLGFQRSPSSPMILLAGPMLSAVVLITARLLGRLAWRAGLTDVIEEEEEKEKEKEGERQTEAEIH